MTTGWGLQMVGWVARLSPVATGQSQEPLRQGTALSRPSGDDQDGVVPRDGAQDARLVDMVDRRCQVVGGSRRRPDHHEVGRDPCGDQQLLALSAQARAHLPQARGHSGGAITALSGHGVHERLALTHLDGTQLDEVTGQGCLSDVKAVTREDLQELALGSHAAAPESVQDELTSASLGLRYHEAGSSPCKNPGSALTKESSWAVVMTSGGASLSTSGVGALMMKPPARARSATSAATSARSTMARSRPAPRTPKITGWASAATESSRWLPAAVACASSPWLSIVSRTARPAAAASGLPPKVEPC